MENGCGPAHAFRWEEKTGMVDLGSLVSGRSTQAMGVSGDGRVVVGGQDGATGYRQGARWVDGRQELFTGPAGGVVGSTRAVNRDGSIVAGRQCRPDLASDQSAWIWTPNGGTECLPAPGRKTSQLVVITEANAMSDDGRVIGGRQGAASSTDQDAVIWIDRSPAYLKDFLRANGVPDAFATWINTGEITGVSPDGRDPRRLRGPARGLPRVHGDPRFQGGDAMSRAVATAVIAGLLLVCGARSEAQSWEASFLAGYTPDAGLDRRAPEFDALDIRGGFTWGGSVSRSLGQRWGAEVSWMQQQSGLKLGAEDGSPTLFEFTVGDLHGDAVYHFADRDAKLRPFLFAGLGATFFSGGGQPSETKLSWGAGRRGQVLRRGEGSASAGTSATSR